MEASAEIILLDLECAKTKLWNNCIVLQTWLELLVGESRFFACTLDFDESEQTANLSLGTPLSKTRSPNAGIS